MATGDLVLDSLTVRVGPRADGEEEGMGIIDEHRLRHLFDVHGMYSRVSPFGTAARACTSISGARWDTTGRL